MKFLVLDFGMDDCSQAFTFQDDFEEYPELYALSRLYYVTFAVQSELTWRRFLRDAVVPLIRAKNTAELEKLERLTIKQLKVASGGGKGKCAILVDEIMKVKGTIRCQGDVCVPRYREMCPWVQGEVSPGTVFKNK